MSKSYDCDVAIIGGGPAGATAGSLIKKYSPETKVVILERESFPREHVGESQLPAISSILNELGVWDKVEAANFPIKVGATYRWGSTKGYWKFDFLLRPFVDEPRPAKFSHQRESTAFQVDRSVYDKILLDHAREMGCEVYEQVRVDQIDVEGDQVLGLNISCEGKSSQPASALHGVTRVQARHYVDGSGVSAMLRKKLEIGVHSPTNLRNIAIWDYWQNAEWAESVGTGGTRIQVLSLSWGWLWFIPISPTRTSIGLVLPASYYKERNLKPEEIYLEAIAADPRVSKLITKASREKLIQTTNDWSYISDRIVGENWFLAGDACGFADPILSAGMTLAHTSGRRVAYSILEIDRGDLDAAWVRSEYEQIHRDQILHHIRFADFWYSSNGCFTDLKENCSEIAKHAGLELSAQEAFRWLSTGGFAGEDQSFAMKGTYRFSSIKVFTEALTDGSIDWTITKKNEYRLNLIGAQLTEISFMRDGRIEPTKCYRRGQNVLPLSGMYRIVHAAISREPDAMRAFALIRQALIDSKYPGIDEGMFAAYEVIESMIVDGWITAKVNKKRPLLGFSSDTQKSTTETAV
ncbi:MAG: NAD(P)/FAD-dependent oxidoreductase [Fimbriimonas sp.]|nr:NAD(P)/FAD-dependent oxidoreductase [Fimbriimonas sp.]